MKSHTIPQLLVEAGSNLELLESRLQEKQNEIDEWFQEQWEKTPPPIYGSVDMRNAGFKLAPVDMNLFPAGFNNLNAQFLQDVVQTAKNSILQRVPQTRHIVIIPENYTRNIFYWENVWALVNIVTQAGFDVRVGSLNAEMTVPIEIKLGNEKCLLLEPLIREQEKIRVGDNLPDMLLLNNDLSAGVPSILQHLQQPLFPPAKLGWHQRLKSEHFQYYADVSGEFADRLSIDSWFITPLFRHCGEIDFLRSEGLECLEEHTRVLLADIKRKYQEYGVPSKPFVMVKADAGTQGMAVMTVRDIKELRHLNRRQRTTMAKSKGGIPVKRVIVQEGVYTFETLGERADVAEPVVYLWGKQVAGGFYRVHQGRSMDENLNTPGMHFESMPFAWSCCSQPKGMELHPYQKHLFTYGVIAQLSMLAAAREMQNL